MYQSASAQYSTTARKGTWRGCWYHLTRVLFVLGGMYVAGSKVKRENYISVHGWMLVDLGLKGNELLIYACIYGFSQAENQVFSGSLQYLADWTNSTKQGVIKCLKSLVEKGYIVKNDKTINGVKFCEYHATELTGVLNKVDRGMQQSLTGGIKPNLPNNLVPDTDIDKLGNKKDIYVEIISYLNAKLGTSYRATTKATQEHINARLKDGFTVEDFYKVIDNRCKEWKGTKMAEYLRPSTLFGPKFEGYLNSQAGNEQKNKNHGAWGNLPGMQVI